METLAIIKLIMSLVDKILGQLPDKEEREKRKKEKAIKDWNDLTSKYLEEINMPKTERDYDVILNMRDEMILRASEYSK